jgi:hypothetical protein
LSPRALKISDSKLKLEFEFSSRAENIGTENIGIDLYPKILCDFFAIFSDKKYIFS